MNMMNTNTALRTALALSAVMTTGIALAQSTGVSHPDEVIISTSSQTAPVQGSSLPASNMPGSGMPVDRYATQTSVVVAPDAASPKPSAAIAVEAANTPSLTPRNYASVAEPTDQDGGVVVRVPGPSDRLPEGTLMKVRLGQRLSTQATPLGVEWTAELIESMSRDGVVMVPAGSILHGKVTEVHGGKRISGQASIHLTTLSVVLPDGTMRGVHAQVIDTDYNHGVRVNEEGTLLHRENRKEEAGVMALTVGSGAAAGGVIAGVPGALVGAGVGAGVSGVLYLKEDKQAELPKDTIITFELTRSMGFGQE